MIDECLMRESAVTGLLQIPLLESLEQHQYMRMAHKMKYAYSHYYVFTY